MHSVTETLSASKQHVQEVARKFITLYYPVLNNYAEYLFQFYGSDSTVVFCDVKENGLPETTKAENPATVRELLLVLYGRITVIVRSCTPQSSSSGCISLLVSGVVQQKDSNDGKAFTQALILSQQRDGYYIKTDTTLVFPLGNGMPGSYTLLPPAPCAVRAPTELAETPAIQSLTTTTMPQNVQKMMNGGVNPLHSRMSSFDLMNGTPQLGHGCRSSGSSHRMKHPVEGALNQNEGKGGVTFEVQPRGALADYNHRTKVADLSTQKACHVMMSSGKGGVSAFGSGDIPVQAGADGCTSPLSAPGALATPLVANGLMMDFGGHAHFQPWSLKSSPRIGIAENIQKPMTNETKQLFACKLPLGSTVEEVTAAFAPYGPLSDSDPVRVFTGPDNCYACVTYLEENDMQKALAAQIQIGNKTVVTDVWRPRDRRPRRRRADNAHEQNAIATAN